MKVYLLSQNENRDYNTFGSMVVVAESEETARNIHPLQLVRETVDWGFDCSWVSDPSLVKVKCIGEADKSFKVPTVVCTSFNAG